MTISFLGHGGNVRCRGEIPGSPQINPSWLSLAQAVSIYKPTVDQLDLRGGLRWQIFTLTTVTIQKYNFERMLLQYAAPS